MRNDLVPAFVLHSRRYRETSLLLDVLAQGHGRVAMVAKGARRARSRSGAQLQCFHPLRVSWLASGEMGTLTAAEASGPPVFLGGERLMCGLYLNELLVRSLPRDDPDSDLFEAYAHAIASLAAAPVPGWVLRRFELTLLECSGYGLGEDACDGEGLPLQPQARYRFEPGSGVLPAPGQAGTVSGAALLALNDEEAPDAMLQGELRRFLHSCLQQSMDTPTLRSRGWLQELNQLLSGD